jgi:Protein of unknown function (DUF1638)
MKSIIIACGSMEPELEALRPGPEIEIRYVDQSLHLTPSKMLPILQEQIDKANGKSDRLVLCYGLCSNGIVGLTAPEQGLIIPRVHDCIALLLGSREEFQLLFQKRSGSYYLTPGWIREEKDPIGILENVYAPRVGLQEAEEAIKLEMQHYTHLVLIDTGTGEIDKIRQRAQTNADYLDLTLEEVKGSDNYFEKILFGPYSNSDFVIIEPREKVTQAPFLV